MYNATFVDVGYGVKDLVEHATATVGRWVFGEVFAEVASIDVFHHDAGADGCLCLVGVVVGDVVMVERNGHFIFSLENAQLHRRVIFCCLYNEMFACFAHAIEACVGSLAQ